MGNKKRILFLLRYLQENSDEQRALTKSELRKALAEKGYYTSNPVLLDDIDTLIDSGYDIDVTESFNGIPTDFSYVDREFSGSELQILIDAVSSSRFLTTKMSQELIRKLVKLAGPSDAETLRPDILVSENIKAKNDMILINVQTIRESIVLNRKIRFQYFTYNLKKKKKYRHDGEYYIISPYATIWMDDRYYVVGYSDKREGIVRFRVDRMDIVQVTDEERVPEPEAFDLHDYSEKIFKMYGEEEEEREVTLRCKHERMDQVIDKFGDKIVPVNVTKNTFDIKVPVSLSRTFFAWVFQYTGSMAIVEPEKAYNWYISMLQDALDDTLAEGE